MNSVEYSKLTDEQIISLVNDSKFDINQKDIKGYTILMHSITDRPSIIDIILEHKNCDLNIIDSEKFSCLMLAIVSDETKIANKLIDKGCDLNYCNSDGWSAIFFALLWNPSKPNTELVNKLIDMNCDLNISDVFGNDILSWTCKKNYHELAKKIFNKLFGNNDYQFLKKKNCIIKDNNNYDIMIKYLIEYNLINPSYL